MDPLTIIDYQRELLRAEYRTTTNLPITTQVSLLLGANRFLPFYPGVLSPISFLYSPFLWRRQW